MIGALYITALQFAHTIVPVEQSRNTFTVLVGKPEGNKTLGRLRYAWEDNIKMDLREVGYNAGDWIVLLKIGTNCGLLERSRGLEFENKVPKNIFGAKRDEFTEEWRKLHNAELHALYSSPNILRNLKSRQLRWAGRVARKE